MTRTEPRGLWTSLSRILNNIPRNSVKLNTGKGIKIPNNIGITIYNFFIYTCEYVICSLPRKRSYKESTPASAGYSTFLSQFLVYFHHSSWITLVYIFDIMSRIVDIYHVKARYLNWCIYIYIYVLLASSQHNLYDIYLLQCIQY